MKLLQIIVLIAISSFAYSQQGSFYESIEYKRAYEKGTRLRTGVPGEAYWQNRSDYEIKATFEPVSRLIEGHLKVTYFNESPDSINLLVFKLMQNVYKKGGNRQMAVDEINIHDGIKIENVKVNEELLDERSINISGTVMRISLSSFISSNSTGVIELDFITPLPKASGYRSGTIDSTSFFAAYWFPQLAVYDDIIGWDMDEYVGIAENYNDFSTYQVELTLPSQYNIWATGEHLNKEEIFPSEVIKRISVSKISSKPVMIISEKDFRQEDGKTYTWKFKADNVPDFAWGTSDHYVWEGVAANNPNPRNPCWVQSAYPIGAKNFDWVVDVAKKAVEIFSNSFPGVPYPYFKHISFRGTQGGGMEFPMLANNNIQFDSVNTVMVTAHELAHNYFPFMMGINERKYGWWDETMTTLMESYVNQKGYPSLKQRGFLNRKISFNYLAPNHDILPIITETSNIMKVYPAVTNFYVKGPAGMDVLVNIIGANKFYAYTKEFMEIWVGKHPTPYDFFYFINEQEGESLNWFWDAWFFSYGYPDLGITHAEQNDEYLTVTLKNVGGLPIQFKLIINYTDGSALEEDFSVKAWKDNLENISVRIPIAGIIENVSIDNRFAYDVDPSNNDFQIKK